MTKRGSTAFITWVIACSWQRVATASAEEASTCAATKRSSPSALTAFWARVVVVVGDDAQLEEVTAGRDAGEGGSDASGADQEDAHAVVLRSGGWAVSGLGGVDGTGSQVVALTRSRRWRRSSQVFPRTSKMPNAKTSVPITLTWGGVPTRELP